MAAKKKTSKNTKNKKSKNFFNRIIKPILMALPIIGVIILSGFFIVDKINENNLKNQQIEFSQMSNFEQFVESSKKGNQDLALEKFDNFSTKQQAALIILHGASLPKKQKGVSSEHYRFYLEYIDSEPESEFDSHLPVRVIPVIENNKIVTYSFGGYFFNNQGLKGSVSLKIDGSKITYIHTVTEYNKKNPRKPTVDTEKFSTDITQLIYGPEKKVITKEEMKHVAKELDLYE